MAYNISALPVYNDETSRAFMTRAILGAQTIKMLLDANAFDGTAKGNKAVQLANTDVQIQDGSTCGRNALGDTVLGEAILSVKDLKVNLNYCVRDLEKTYAVQDMKAKMAGQVYDDGLFLDFIGTEVSDKVQAALEQMIWKGDKASGATATLKQIDGFVKQITGATYIHLSGGTSGDTISQLQAFDLQMPVEIANKEDYRIFIGTDTYRKYVSQIAAKNLFNPNDQLTLWGSVSKLAPVDGLNSTGAVVAARMSQLQAGGEMQDVALVNKYSMETEQVYFDSRFSLGVVPIYTESIGYGTIK
ncbi:hypothetical protein [Mucilaginibacter kameinonensis]|uniref:hypothetical protein n=1 Tax=Mucilaginibacter kameinonensis TaxID=452286 RepID=UPI0013CECA3C|nr:hypothetical protein [Mucilaginibacter kameinonensis]